MNLPTACSDKRKGLSQKLMTQKFISSVKLTVFKGNDGVKHQVDYTADQNGYRAKVTSLKTVVKKWEEKVLTEENDDDELFLDDN